MSLQDLVKKYKIRLMVQFGSTVNGFIHQESDIDIAYLNREILDLTEEGQLVLDLADVFKFPLDKIDLVRIKFASPLLLKEIFTQGKLLYQENNTLFDQFRIYSGRLFEESRPIFENNARVLQEAVKSYKQELDL
jgi:predicted nucleotidyltransferase